MVGESMLKFLKEVGRADIAVFFVKGKLLCSTKKLWKVMHQVKCPLGEWIQKPGIACGERYAWFLGQVEYHQLKQIQNVMKLLPCYFECTKLCFIQAISYRIQNLKKKLTFESGNIFRRLCTLNPWQILLCVSRWRLSCTTSTSPSTVLTSSTRKVYSSSAYSWTRDQLYYRALPSTYALPPWVIKALCRPVSVYL